MYDFSKASATENYFKDIINRLKDSKISGVYCVISTWFSYSTFTYMQDEPLFIIFENGQCLVIEYYEINKLNVEYREMTVEERKIFDESDIKDLFNRTTKIHNGRTRELMYIEKSELAYESLDRIELKRVTEEYSTWIDGAIVEGIKPTGETFNEIKFIMKNGKSFIICADDPEDDGYSLLWSEDAKISSTTV